MYTSSDRVEAVHDLEWTLSEEGTEAEMLQTYF